MKLQEILHVKGRSVYTIGPDAMLADVVQRLVEYNCGSLVVCQGDRMIGIVTERDILQACALKQGPLEELPVQRFMTSNPLTGVCTDQVEHVMGLMTENRIRHLPIVEDGKLTGIISIGDVVKAQHDQLSMENHYLKSYIPG